MGKNVNSLLNERLKPSSTKMAVMAKQSANGNLSSFSGIFHINELNLSEKVKVETILQEYGSPDENITDDLKALLSITAEVKAINHQAALLHGERIKKAQTILKNYSEGAFTAWLIATYGNRQTPYNFLQYFEFCQALPKPLRELAEIMPRQAIYTLASREGEITKKHEIIQKYNDQTKAELLRVIRDAFPLKQIDRRRQNIGDMTLNTLRKMFQDLSSKKNLMTKKQKNSILELLSAIGDLVENSP